ncbi:MAG TPA: glucose-1-phosphate adenylyltransferase [Caldithrix sp.]|nr:glucose-1-phosphate adenylyltransferase [Caldithrix sp.]
MKKVITIILAGGQGKRLFPLTKMRSKPAVPIAGKFRLIDIPISNCIHSNLRKIFISTQFATESLHRHIMLTYWFDNFSKDFVTILAAEQTPERKAWYQGTADAVRKNLRFLKRKGDLVLILSGDHLYRMDYRKFIDFHCEKNADISISVSPVTREEAKGFGVMKVNRNARIISFMEKPKHKVQLEEMQVSPEIFRKFGIEPNNRTHLASMGVYLFNWDVLEELLENTRYIDFGKEVIPSALKSKKVYSYFFDGYWQDIGTIDSFFKTQIELTKPLPDFNFYDEEKPIFTHARFLPGSKILSSNVSRSILCEGSIINNSTIQNSIVGLRTRIGEGSELDEAIIMGADIFETKEEIAENRKRGIPSVGIGPGSTIKRAIIDKNARIGSDVKLVGDKNKRDLDTENYYIRDGIVVVPKNAVIPDGTEV